MKGASGWAIRKEKRAHKIGSLIALVMQPLAAVEKKGVFAALRTATFGSYPSDAFAELSKVVHPREPDIPTLELGFANRFGDPCARQWRGDATVPLPNRCRPEQAAMAI